ncbi:MAG: 4-hydroxy-tetrahydrodipicolinate synthase [Lachnospiraceae bacterium]|jgi:4-hydroxy-tetrahydrodipicolinate synthase
MSIFKGSAVALITPFDETGAVDKPKLFEIVEDQIQNGTDAIVICGTTGEGSTLTEEEHIQTIRWCVKAANGRIPVIAGTGSNDTRTAIMLTQAAEKAGADACLVVTPYYNKATQEGLIRHFTAVAESTKLPIILYNVPSRTGCNIQPKTAVTLAKTVENIVAIKEASGNISQVAELASLAKGCIDIYSGNDDQIVPLLSLGGIGVISVLANIAPKETHDMVMSFLDGDTKTAMDIQLRAIDLCNALFCEVNPIPVKKAMDLKGWNAGGVRLPLTEMTEGNAVILEKAMKEFGCL